MERTNHLLTLAFCLLFFQANLLLAQPSPEALKIDPEYDRNSVSFITLATQAKGLPDGFPSELEIAENNKFFYNYLPYDMLIGPDSLSSPEMDPDSVKENFFKKILKNAGINTSSKPKVDYEKKGKALARFLEKENVGADILKVWSKKDSEGFYRTLLDRSKFNISAQENFLDIDPRKLNVIQPMMGRNFIYVFENDLYGSIKEYYIKKEINNTEEPEEGIKADVRVHIFRLSIDKGLFHRELKARFGDDQAMYDYSWPIEYVATWKRDGLEEETGGRFYQGMSKSEKRKTAWKELVKKAFNKALAYSERNIQKLKVKTPVVAANPIQANIGTRENLQIDNRYFVYELRYDQKKDQMKAARVAVLRATHDICNNFDSLRYADGGFRSSTFRKITGGKISPGMFMVEQKDFGISASAGLTFRKDKMIFSGRFGYNISPILHSISIFSDAKMEGTRLFGEVIFEQVDNVNVADKSAITRFGIGFSKDLLLSRWIDVQPFLGYYFQSAGELDRDIEDQATENIPSDGYLKVGVRVPITILHNVFLVPEVAATTQGEGPGNNTNFPFAAMLRIDF